MVSMTSQNYLIAGDCGVVGVHTAARILERDAESKVTILENPSLDIPEPAIPDSVLDSPRFNRLIGSISNRKLVEDTIRSRNIDAVLLIAPSRGKSADRVQETRRSLLGLTHFLEALRLAPKIKSFVYVSSEKVYAKEGPKIESTPVKPWDCEGAGMGSCEAMINAYWMSYQLPLIIARVSSFICAPSNSYNTAVHDAIHQSESSASYESNGSIIDARDVADGLLACAHNGKPGQVYNIGGDNELNGAQLRSLVQKVQAHESIASSNIRTAQMNSNKAFEELKWRPAISVISALQECFEEAGSGKSRTAPLKFLVYGARGWIGQQFVELLKSKGIDFAMGNTRPGTDEDEKIMNEVVQVAPSHVVSMIGRTHGPGVNSIAYLEGGPAKLNENIRDNLYAPCVLAWICETVGVHFTYLGTGCIFQYNDEHPFDGKPYKESDYGNYSATSYSAVKLRTDWLMRYYPNALNARIRLPVNFEMDSRNLVAKMINFKRVYDIPNSVSILPDCLPILLDLAIKRHCGTINLVNPGPIRFPQIVQLYKQLVDPSVQFQVVQPEKDDEVLKSRAQCALDTSELQRLYPDIEPAIEGIRKAILSIASHKLKSCD